MRWSSKNLGVGAVLGGTSLLLAVGCAERPQATKEQAAARGVEQQLVDVAARTERDVSRERASRDLDSRSIGGAIPASLDPGGVVAGTTQSPGGAFFGGVRPDTTTSSLSTPTSVEGTPNVRVDPKPVVTQPQPRPRPPGGWGTIRAACGRG